MNAAKVHRRAGLFGRFLQVGVAAGFALGTMVASPLARAQIVTLMTLEERDAVNILADQSILSRDEFRSLVDAVFGERMTDGEALKSIDASLATNRMPFTHYWMERERIDREGRFNPAWTRLRHELSRGNPAAQQALQDAMEVAELSNLAGDGLWGGRRRREAAQFALTVEAVDPSTFVPWTRKRAPAPKAAAAAVLEGAEKHAALLMDQHDRIVAQRNWVFGTRVEYQGAPSVQAVYDLFTDDRRRTAAGIRAFVSNSGQLLVVLEDAARDGDELAQRFSREASLALAGAGDSGKAALVDRARHAADLSWAAARAGLPRAAAIMAAEAEHLSAAARQNVRKRPTPPNVQALAGTDRFVASAQRAAGFSRAVADALAAADLIDRVELDDKESKARFVSEARQAVARAKSLGGQVPGLARNVAAAETAVRARLAEAAPRPGVSRP